MKIAFLVSEMATYFADSQHGTSPDISLHLCYMCNSC